MNPRLIRALVVVIAIAIGITSAYFVRDIEREIDAQRAASDALRERAAALAATIADIRSGQFGYVARGQAEAFWMSHVASVVPELQKQTTEFEAALTSPAARAALEPAAAALENFRTLDNRVRDFVQSGSYLLAADLIFSDGVESTTAAGKQVSAALGEELRERANAIAALRARQRAMLGGTAAVLLLIIAGLALGGSSPAKPAEPEITVPPVEPLRFEAPLPRAKPAVTPRLVTTAQLCGELTRVTDSTQLPTLLERAARVIDATGIIVWVFEPERHSLVPAVSHGYEDKVISRMGRIHRDANNAAAAAFRTSELRTASGDASHNGALIVPITTGEGCVGVMSAEMKGGSEKDECSQALAAIFAAQLATLVATPGHSGAGGAHGAPPEAAPIRAAAQA